MAAEQLEVGADMIGGEGQVIHDHVELQVADGLPHRWRVSDVAGQHARLGRCGSQRGCAAVHHEQLEAGLDRLARTRRADHACAADEEHAGVSHGTGLPQRGLAGSATLPEVIAHISAQMAGLAPVQRRTGNCTREQWSE